MIRKSVYFSQAEREAIRDCVEYCARITVGQLIHQKDREEYAALTDKMRDWCWFDDKTSGGQ